jgi:hypothetical protein
MEFKLQVPNRGLDTAGQLDNKDDRWVEKSEISTLRLLYESNELRILGDNGENWAKDIPIGPRTFLMPTQPQVAFPCGSCPIT